MFEVFGNYQVMGLVIFCMLICIFFGYALCTTKVYKIIANSLSSKLISDQYYAYAVISFTFKSIQYYVGNILVAEDQFDIVDGSSLQPGNIMNGFIKDHFLTVVNIKDDMSRATYLDIGNVSQVSLFMRNMFPVIIIS